MEKRERAAGFLRTHVDALAEELERNIWRVLAREARVRRIRPPRVIYFSLCLSCGCLIHAAAKIIPERDLWPDAVCDFLGTMVPISVSCPNCGRYFGAPIAYFVCWETLARKRRGGRDVSERIILVAAFSSTGKSWVSAAKVRGEIPNRTVGRPKRVKVKTRVVSEFPNLGDLVQEFSRYLELAEKRASEYII